MSGFTSTGATILDNIEELPHGLLFWRSLTQWVGGMGIVFFTIAVLPIFGVGGIQLFAAEATGPTHNKLHPRIGVTAKWLWSLYLGMTLVGMVLLMLGGMDWFDGLNHAMTATSTGGFSTKQDSIAFYHSAYIEYVLILLMFLSGINFSLLFFTLLRGRFRKLFEDTEFRWYAGTVLGFSLFCTAVLIAYGSSDWERSFRDALFQVVSVQTTTGYASADYMLWPPVLWLVISFVMYFGACAGSTSGAIKCVRIAILAQIVRNQFKRILHPNAVLPIRISHQVVPTVMQSTLLAFMVVYMLAVFFGWLLVMFTGVDFMESYGIVVSSVSNVGPALGHYGPAYSWNALPDAAKWICSFLMLIGRLELFSVLLLFTSGFWKKH
jgi:trk system potassium uptake protein TrkH